MKLPRPLSLSVDTVARAAVGKDWSLYATLIEHWGEIVGQEYAKKTSPTKITFPKGKKAGQQWAGGTNRGQSGGAGGVLTIKLPQGLTMEFGLLTDQIQQRINGFFGYEAIQKIRFEPYYSKETQEEANPTESQLTETEILNLEDSLKCIKNSELREALEKLGESVLRESKC